ncbi:MAG: putative DNA binding domain-containing protein [Rhodobacteraceae bacterium]|nr:putative DNA binding domain-containing protein [Paracoccaceae bacterium]MCY4249001.1 putative DNA binding domain-containing protein [Paracoccaceae bacterium]
MDNDRCQEIVKDLLEQSESEWLEFKHNNSDPNTIGQLISAISNGSNIKNKSLGWVVWGIEDKTQKIVGTTFDPDKKKIGTEELKIWLLKNLQPAIQFNFTKCVVNCKNIVLLEIPAATSAPISFKGERKVRIGSSTRNLLDFPEVEKGMWENFKTSPQEERSTATGLDTKEVVNLLHYEAYYSLFMRPIPSSEELILEELKNEGFIEKGDKQRWIITNLGALLFAKNLKDFRELERKSINLIIYQGRSRVNSINRKEFVEGYAISFQKVLQNLDSIVPPKETIRQGRRTTEKVYPDLALRELLANALIHQDINLTNTLILIEVFEDRIEITNPGTSLVEIDRLIDSTPQTRNEKIASFMRRVGFCEEAGTGADKVVNETELNILPPPLWEEFDESFRAKFYASKDFKDLTPKERVRACYQHTCLMHLEGNTMNNTTLRERFGISKRNRAQVTRVINSALNEGVIKKIDPAQGRRYVQYTPKWA